MECKGDLTQTDRLGHAATNQETTAHTCIFTVVYSGTMPGTTKIICCKPLVKRMIISLNSKRESSDDRELKGDPLEGHCLRALETWRALSREDEKRSLLQQEY